MPVTLHCCTDCHRVWGAERDLCTCGSIDFKTIAVAEAEDDV